MIRCCARRYLKDARKRLNSQLTGIELDLEDVYAMQMMCAYEVHIFIQIHGNPSLTHDDPRPLLSDIPSSASCLPLKSGKGLITRRDHQRMSLRVMLKLSV